MITFPKEFLFLICVYFVNSLLFNPIAHYFASSKIVKSIVIHLAHILWILFQNFVWGVLFVFDF
jgi:hypothetical protein